MQTKRIVIGCTVMLVLTTIVSVLLWPKYPARATETSILSRQIELTNSLYHSWREDLKLIGVQGSTADITLETFRKTPTGIVQRIADSAHSIRYDLFELWRQTGYCAFADIPTTQVVHFAPVILQRYRAICGDMEGMTLPARRLMELDRNIEMLRTEYCWAALGVVENTVFFVDAFPLDDSAFGATSSDCTRGALHRSMADWYTRNRSELGWNEQLRKWTFHGTDRGFAFPISSRQMTTGDCQ